MYADCHTQKLSPLVLSDGLSVLVLDKEKKVGFPAKVVTKHADRSYIVETESGKQLRRNRVQLREIYAPSNTMNTPPQPPAAENYEPIQVAEPQQNSANENINTQPDAIPSPESIPKSPPKGILKKPNAAENERKTRSGRSVKIPERYR